MHILSKENKIWTSAKILFVIFFVGLFFSKCTKNSESRVTILNIEPKVGYVSPRPPGAADSPASIPAMKAIEVGKSDTMYLTLNRIQGFAYEEGYKYVIKVSIARIKNPTEDGYVDSYKLIELISKTKES